MEGIKVTELPILSGTNKNVKYCKLHINGPKSESLINYKIEVSKY